MSDVYYDLVIVGAGAAGLCAGIAFLRNASREGGEPKVLIVDANDEVGHKLLATGNGRCNLSNVSADGYEHTIEFFRSLGVLTTVDSAGRVYPLSKRALVVRDALLKELRNLGATIYSGMKVSAVRQGRNDDFIVQIDAAKGKDWILKQFRDGGRLKSRQVIVAAGGKAGSQYGATGDSYAIARSLGIEVNSIVPALVPFAIEESQVKQFKSLAGVRANAKVRLLSGADVVAESEGEVQFTEKAISGICIFDLSLSYLEAVDSVTPLRSAQNDVRGESNGSAQGDVRGERNGSAQGDVKRVCNGSAQGDVKRVSNGSAQGGVRVFVDFAPDFSEKDLTALLGENLAARLAGIVHEKLAAFIVRHCERSAAIQSSDKNELPAIYAHMIKNFTVPISGTLGWKEAQVTAGGVKLSELDEAHMESTKCPGVYFVGEAVDYTGLCGGFNLDFAWNSGIKAGKRAAGFYNHTLKE